MPQEIYNEGRVVGFSAWELYKRLALAKGVAEEDVPSEQEWLASSIGHGASMILRIPRNSSGIIDIPLPSSSTLSAAGVITASPFIGECEYNTSTGIGWAKKVTSYGDLISNTPTSYPTSSDVPYADSVDPNIKAQLMSYIKIYDGIYYTNNADWVDSVETRPTKDIIPNFSDSSGVIRLRINGSLDSDIQILFTGFIDKSILQGICGYASSQESYVPLNSSVEPVDWDNTYNTRYYTKNIDGQYIQNEESDWNTAYALGLYAYTTGAGGSTDTISNKWANGGMLGPDIFPWANKIIFIVPTAINNILSSFQRTLPSDAELDDSVVVLGNYTLMKLKEGSINPKSIIDLSSIYVNQYYYTNNQTDSLIKESAQSVNLGTNDSYSVLTAWYPGLTASKINELKSTGFAANNSIFPPALYAMKTEAGGAVDLAPLDTAAPGTLKVFEDAAKAMNYMTMLPNNYAIFKSGNNYFFSSKDNPAAVRIATGSINVPTKTSDLVNDGGTKSSSATTWFISNTDNPITFSPNSRQLILKFKDGGGTRNSEFLNVTNEDAKGHTVGLGGGGLTFVGGGESATTDSAGLIANSNYKQLGISQGEHLILSADSTVYICPDISNISEAANRKTTFTASGKIQVDTLKGTGNRLLYVDKDGVINAKSGDLVAGTGIKISGTTIGHSNNVTKGMIGSNSASNGASISIPYANYDAQGHITSKGTRTHTVNRIQQSNDSNKYLEVTSAGVLSAKNISELNLNSFKILDSGVHGQKVEFRQNNDRNNSLLFAAFTGTQFTGWALAPNADGGDALGAPNHRWKVVYSQTPTISTSDKNKKKDIDYDLDEYESLYQDLKPVSYKFKDGTSNRTHIGFISQDVEDSLSKNNLSALDFAGFCKDPKFDENDKIIEGEYEYSLRYDEFIALNTHMIQKLMKRVDALEKELEEYKNK